MLWVVVTTVGLVLVVRQLLKPASPSNGVYRLPGRWYSLKKAVFLVLFYLRKHRAKKAAKDDREYSSRKNRGYGQGKGDPAHMERVQQLEEEEHALDAVYFAGFSSDGAKVVCRVGRRHGRQAEVWLYLDIPGVGILQHPVHPDTRVLHTPPHTFQAGGLRIECREPMQSWHLSYSGPLRVGLCNDIENKPEKCVETTFSFMWNAFTETFNFDTDISPSAVADAIAREPWSREFWEKLRSKHQTHYEQWGEMRGRVCVEGFEEKTMFFKTVRDHSFGVRNWCSFYRYAVHFIYCETGLVAQVGAISLPENMSNLRCGYLSYPNGDMFAVDSTDLRLEELGEGGEPPLHYSFSFTAADGQRFAVEVEGGDRAVWYHHDHRGGRVVEMFCNYRVNGLKAWGLTEFFYRNLDGPAMEPGKSVPLLQEPDLEKVKDFKDSLTLTFDQETCCCSRLVGGKGSQLATLTQIQKELDMKVPHGFCITLEAFMLQLKEFSELERAVQRIDECAKGGSVEELQRECSEALEQFALSPVCPAVEAAILEGLRKCFPGREGEVRLAVRSSAAGEDGSEASFAGQMETFLGIKGPKAVLEAVRKCWASAFAYQAVEYRRQHGQTVRAVVGVVVQEMVGAEVAGVMFTADPISGSWGRLVINASLGLGEAVVSGKVEPDTVTISRDCNDMLRITERTAGNKAIAMAMKEGGVGQVKVDAGTASKCCLKDEAALRLARVGVKLEQYFGSSRDVEWAMEGDTIYLLQSRPITVAEHESELELMREFDSALVSDNIRLTTCNISEIMPGAVTPLTSSVFARVIDEALNHFLHHCGATEQLRSTPHALLSEFGHLFINLTFSSSLAITTAMTTLEACHLSLTGEILEDMTLSELNNYVGRPCSRLQRIVNAVKLLRRSRSSHANTKAWEKRVVGYSVAENCSTAQDVYDEICRKLPEYKDAWTETMANSSRSGSMAMVIMMILTQGSTDWKPENFGDFALLLSECHDVYSAEVPHQMQALAKEINEAGLKEAFLTASDQQCVAMLNSDAHPVLKSKMKQFLDKHGHRCIREGELRELSWRSQPEKLVGNLKSMLSSGTYLSKDRPSLSFSDMVKKLSTSPSFTQRLALRVMLPKARTAVGEREWGKSIAVQVAEEFKLAYWRLAKAMVQEGRLPDEDLLFFLTHSEIGQLLQTHSARLIVRALRRRKILPKQMDLKFPRLVFGHPVPIERKQRNAPTEGGVKLKGMPVSRGCVQGKARVVLRLEEAGAIQAGEILIVNCTDVGWSPYFPLIAGLVTELGGLLSHGAVVAREYGIPCIVNTQGATSFFVSGDEVMLDGMAGTIQTL